MELKNIQKEQEKFIKARNWDKNPASEVFVHLIEEISEIGKHILFETGYKKTKIGSSDSRKNLKREFAHAFNLLLQLAIAFNIDLESAWKSEHELMKKRFSVSKCA